MPIYDFRCRECGTVSEFLLPISFNGRTLTCSGCGSQNLEKLISAPSLLKGSIATSGTTCCGQTQRCETPPCSTGGVCRRD